MNPRKDRGLVACAWLTMLALGTTAYTDTDEYLSDLNKPVPPSRSTIYDAKRRDRTKLVEAYNEGSHVLLICEVCTQSSSHVVPGKCGDRRFVQAVTRRDGVTINTLTFPSVRRQHLNARLVCQAPNTNLAPPETKVDILDINLKPIPVTILSKEKQVSVDKRYEVEYKMTGSRPEAAITWWKNNRKLK